MSLSMRNRLCASAYAEELKKSFKVILADHVTTEAGTGLVHIAPAFGVEDFNAGKKENMPLIDPLDEEGKFPAIVEGLSGLHFKDADKIILKNLKEAGLLFDRSVLVHSYPFCWRSNTPLIYKAVPVWFVDVPKIKERMSKHNSDIHWVPESVGHKRFAIGSKTRPIGLFHVIAFGARRFQFGYAMLVSIS